MRSILHITLLCFCACIIWSCSDKQKEHLAPAIGEKDSVPTMMSYGVNTLISDSGVMKYRIVTERWEVNEKTTPPRWAFEKGILLQQYDSVFQVAAVITADTAWYYNMTQLWELRGRVNIRSASGMVFDSEELFWDQRAHELYSNEYSRLFTPERQLEGTCFRSDEYMTNYSISTAKGAVPYGDMMDEPAPPPSNDAANDSNVTVSLKPHAAPKARPKSAITKSDSLARKQILLSRKKM